MIRIEINGEALDLSSGFAMEIEDTNPIYNEKGSQSIPATVPPTARNRRLLGMPHRIDSAEDPNNPRKKATVSDGIYNRLGSVNVTEASPKAGITLNIGYDNSEMYLEWKEKRLCDIEDLPVYEPYVAGVSGLLEELYDNFMNANPQSTDFAVFPLAINVEDKEVGDDDPTGVTITGGDTTGIAPSLKGRYWEVLNLKGSDNTLEQPTVVNRIIDSEITEVTIPAGYGVSPFLRVWKVLEMVFADMGLEIISNPFRTNLELSRLVVLNNAADSCCLGKIRYSDLMPDCTVDEFLNSLWVRFGLVCNIRERERKADLRLLKDILEQSGGRDITSWLTEFPTILPETAQYIKLSAKCSLEGAEPATERFEDFVKGLDLSTIRQGTGVASWTTATDSEGKTVWDGDGLYQYEEDPEPEDPQEPEDPDYPDPDEEGPEYAMMAMPRAQSGSAETSADECCLAREYEKVQWHKLDITNGKTRQSSTSFFNWDPQPEGLEAMELSSADEWVPVGFVRNWHCGTGWNVNTMLPQYLAGARHYHTYIKGGGDTEDNDGDSTPLAFLFAYTTWRGTVGRFCPETEEGIAIRLADGTSPSLSLLFQFRDGLFAQFWRRYDELLRHGNRTVEVSARMPKLDLYGLDLLDAVKVQGVRCMIDKNRYTLPGGREVESSLTLRPIQTQGEYDIEAEQGVPDIASVAAHLAWKAVVDGFLAIDTEEVRAKVVADYISANSYQPHGEWYLGAESAVVKRKTRIGLTWQSDPSVGEPYQVDDYTGGTYTATVTFAIVEIRNLSDDPEYPDIEPSDEPIGEVTVNLQYDVELEAKIIPW